jgi:hypothetical protein
MELASAADAEHPQVGSEIDALGNLRVVELVVENRHLLVSSGQMQVQTPTASRERRFIQRGDTFHLLIRGDSYSNRTVVR